MEKEINIKLKFNVGDEFYCLHSDYDPHHVDCKACDGKGIIQINGCDFKCMTCNGSGKKSYNISKVIIEKIKITEIRIPELNISEDVLVFTN